MRTEYQEMISKNSQKLTQSDDRLDHLEESAYDINNNIEELDKNAKEHVKKLESMNREVEVAKKCVNDLANKTESLNTAMEKVNQESDNASQRMRQLDDRLTTVEEHGQQGIEKVKTRVGELKTDFEELKTNHSDLCQMMDNKLKPLIQLRHILNTKVKEKNEQLKEQKDILKELSALKSDMQSLRRECARPAGVGFTAAVTHGYIPTECETVHSYRSVTYNSGHFCRDTTPVKGMYVACLRACQLPVKGKASLYMLKETKNNPHYVLSNCFTTPDNTDCTVVVTEMEADETISVYAVSVDGKPELSGFSTFSCFFVGGQVY